MFRAKSAEGLAVSEKEGLHPAEMTVTFEHLMLM